MKIPRVIELEMRLWGRGLIPLPRSYIKFHEQAARTDMARRRSWTVLSARLVGDMEVMEIVVTLPVDDSKTKTLRWSEAGGWLQLMDGGRWDHMFERLEKGQEG